MASEKGNNAAAPGNILSPQFLKDEHTSEILTTGVGIGLTYGALQLILKSSLEHVFANKLQTTGVLGAWGAAGVATLAAYHKGAEILGEVRGDRSSNHFILGFALSLPFTVPKLDPMLTFRRGLFCGAVLGLTHYIVNDEKFTKPYVDRYDEQGHCRLPEVYLIMEAYRRERELNNIRASKQ